MQCEVEAALAALLESGEVPEHAAVMARVGQQQPLACPEVRVVLPDLGIYDALLEAAGVTP